MMMEYKYCQCFGLEIEKKKKTDHQNNLNHLLDLGSSEPLRLLTITDSVYLLAVDLIFFLLLAN